MSCIKRSARKLLLNGNFEYYEELKVMYKGKEKILYNEIINQIQNSNNWYWGNIYIKVPRRPEAINKAKEKAFIYINNCELYDEFN